jgi:hypothetical protein
MILPFMILLSAQVAAVDIRLFQLPAKGRARNSVKCFTNVNRGPLAAVFLAFVKIGNVRRLFRPCPLNLIWRRFRSIGFIGR